MRRFGASPRRATPKGHNLHQLHSTAITRTHLQGPGSSFHGTPIPTNCFPAYASIRGLLALSHGSFDTPSIYAWEAPLGAGGGPAPSSHQTMFACKCQLVPLSVATKETKKAA